MKSECRNIFLLNIIQTLQISCQTQREWLLTIHVSVSVGIIMSYIFLSIKNYWSFLSNNNFKTSFEKQIKM